jgi:ATP-dependent DNA helicase RecG
MPNLITLDTVLATVKSVPPKLRASLEKLGIKTVHDLLWHFPARYEDYTKITKIADLKPGAMVTIRGEVRRVSTRRAWKSFMPIVEVLVTDETGGITLVWFNQPFVTKALQEGMQVNFAGKVFTNKTGMHLSNPSYEIVKGTSVTTHTAGLIPVYPETRGLTSKGIRFVVKQFLDIIPRLDDFLPESILQERQLPSLDYALRHIHFPKSQEQVNRARTRFAFEYVFLLQLKNIMSRAELAREQAYPVVMRDQERQKIVSSLPFTLTDSQRASLDEILLDIARPTPMNRLLQGDVGSGKTAVAAIAAVAVAEAGCQSVFMAPTEVLAKQHYQTLTGVFKNFSGGIALITGSEARIHYEQNLEEKIQKTALIEKIEKGEVSIVIGTHALIASAPAQPAKNKKAKSALKIQFPKLGLVVIDEQHRFGVSQRAALVGTKKKKTTTKGAAAKNSMMLPHFLSMSATPIPRTLSLAVFGDLDVSTINELPKGRKQIITKVVDPLNRPKAYGFIKQQITAGRQAFFIYPRIENELSTENFELKTEDGGVVTSRTKSLVVSSQSEFKAVKAEYERLSTKVFPDLRVAMLHGKMKATEKAKIMADFKAGKTDILVSTSVIEVGVDVPNATTMVIEGAEHFGLAQLYQFRGRVGRGEHQSFCFLFTESSSETTAARLNALIEARNGFELAEKDLELRGPGQFFGDKQTGMPDSAMQSISDIQLVKAARDSAQKIIEQDPLLATHTKLREKLDLLAGKVHLE